MTEPGSQFPIGIFDSGIGGLTVAGAVMRLLPDETILYVGDTARAPYGPRPATDIIAFSRYISDWLLAQGAKQIVVACNTATAAALNQLRSERPDVTFVGMEPAVKPAVAATRSGTVGVLATQTTIESDRYTELIQRFASHIHVIEDPCLGLVPLIEKGEWTTAPTHRLLTDILEPMLRQGVDTIVLGCTHYPIVAPLIRDIVGPEVALIDPAPAIARRVRQLLDEQDRRAVSDTRPIVHRVYATGPTAAMRHSASHYLGPEAKVETLQLPS